MKQARTRQSALIAVARVAALLSLAGCGAAGGHGLAAGVASPGVGGAGPSAGGAGPGTPTSAAALYPVAAGNTWTYRDNLGTLGTYTGTVRMTAVTRLAAGAWVTMTTSIGMGRSPIKATSTLIVHRDGSITVPLSQLQLGGATSPLGKSGAVTWPTTAELASGRPFTQTLNMANPVGGSNLVEHVTIKGDGSVKVTVPAGTYQAIVVDQAESAPAGSAGAGKVDIRTWMAPGVGPVKTVSTITSAGLTIRVTEDLLSFVRGR